MNVLFVTADQFRGDCLGAAGHPVVRTPNLDRLAAGGTSFRRHFANAVPCAPEPGVDLHRHVHDEPPGRRPTAPRSTPATTTSRSSPAASATSPRSSATPTPASIPGPCADDDPRLFSYEGVLPGFDAVCHLPETAPEEWLAWLRKSGVDVPDEWHPFAYEAVARHRRGGRAIPRSSRRRVFLTDRVLDFVDDTAARGDRPWFVHLSYLRPHPPYLAPRALRHDVRPGVGARAGARADDGRRRRAAPDARRDARAPVDLVAGRRASTARAPGDLLRNDQRGRRPSRPHARVARRVGSGRAHAGDLHVGPRRAARRPLAHAEDRLVRHRVPRAADRARARHRSRARSSAR